MQRRTVARRASPTLVDRVVGYFSPAQGVRRQVAREMLVRAYEGASRADGWRVKRSGASPTADHAADARELRMRARSLAQNVPNIVRAVSAVLAMRVGQGIVPVWADEGLAKRWREWVPHADYDGLLDFYGLQYKAERTRDVDGAVLIRKHIQRMGSTVPLKLQLLEIDFLDVERNGVLAGGREIIRGIEYDKRGCAWPTTCSTATPVMPACGPWAAAAPVSVCRPMKSSTSSTPSAPASRTASRDWRPSSPRCATCIPTVTPSCSASSLNLAWGCWPRWKGPEACRRRCQTRPQGKSPA